MRKGVWAAAGDLCLAKGIRVIQKAASVSGVEWPLETTEEKVKAWVRDVRAVAKTKIKDRDCKTRNILRRTIASKVAALQRLGDEKNEEYYTKVHRAMDAQKSRSLKAVAYDNGGEIKVATDPEEVKTRTKEVWARQFTEPVPMQRAGWQKDIRVWNWEKYIQPVSDNGRLQIGACVTHKELERALQEVQKFTAPGPTGETPEMLVWLDDGNRDRLVQLFNDIIEEGVVPEVWKTVSLHMIYKAGSQANPLNYRPIALMSVAYKLLSKIITYRLYDVVESEGIVSIAQGGFHKQRSTLSHVHALHGCIEDAQKQNKQVYITYVDIANAYDSVPHWAMLDMLHKYNLPDNILHFIGDALTGSKLEVLTKYRPTEMVDVEVGLKQGDPMSPLLFSLFLNPVVCKIHEEEKGYRLGTGPVISMLAFADDIALVAGGEDNMGKMWDDLTNFYYTFGMRVNIAKSAYTSNRHILGETLGFVNRDTGHMERLKVLGRQEAYKYLGVWIAADG